VNGLKLVPESGAPIGDVPANTIIFYPVKLEIDDGRRRLMDGRGNSTIELDGRNAAVPGRVLQEAKICTNGAAIWSVETTNGLQK